MLNGLIQWLRLKLDERSRSELLSQVREVARAIASLFSDAGREASDAMERHLRDGLRDTERDAERAADKTEGYFKRAASRIRTFFGGLSGMLAGIGLGAFIKQMWELGTAADETQSKFNTTFGREASAEMQSFLDQWASLAGLNRTVGQEFSATSGAIVQGMGASRAESAKFSRDMLKLAGDLQSFHNVPIADTFGAIKSGLVGSFEPMDKFGIVLRQSAVNMRALADTGKTNEKQLTDLERAQAALNLMMERAGPAMGDLERTQDSTANKARNLKAEFENLQIELARNLMPVFAGLIDNVEENKKGLGQLAGGAGVVARIVGGVLWQAFNSLASLLAGGVLGSIGMVTLAYRSLENILLRAIVAKEQFKRVFGRGSEEAVASARDDLRRNEADIRDALNQMRAGLGEWANAFNTDAFRQVWNMRPAQGEFDWSSIGPERPPAATPTDPGDARKVERDRQRELSDQVRLLEEMATRRAEFPELVQRATDLERTLTAELESGNVSTKRRLALLNETESLKKIINGTDATSVRIEENRRRNVEAQVELVGKMYDLHGATAEVVALAGQTEAALRQELEKETTELERQLEIIAQLAALDDARLRNAPKTQEELIREDAEAILEHYQALADALSQVAEGFADAWEAAFDRVVSEGGGAADALVAFGRTMGGAVLGALATYARGKMQENLAAAIEQVAYAAASFAHGNAPKGAAHLKSAAGHGASVAAWGVLAGLAGGGANAASGSGAGSAGSRSGGDTVDNAKSGGPEVHIYLDPINENNPEHQRVVLAAGQNGAERYASENVFYHEGVAA